MHREDRLRWMKTLSKCLPNLLKPSECRDTIAFRLTSEGARKMDYAVDVTMESAEQSDSTPY